MKAHLAVFGRAPVPGRVKTRLAKDLGDAPAAELYACFLRDTLRHVDEAVAVLASGASSVTMTRNLWVPDAPADPSLRALLRAAAKDFAAPWPDPHVQCGGDLGEKMAHALESGLQSSDGALVVGSDAPSLPASYLATAARALEVADLVLGPATDGGYYLVGCRRSVPPIFEGVRWSTPHVLADTLERATRAGCQVHLLPPWFDVDEAEDLALLRLQLRVDPELAPIAAAQLIA